jgi:hypothetical protein
MLPKVGNGTRRVTLTSHRRFGRPAEHSGGTIIPPPHENSFVLGTTVINNNCVREYTINGRTVSSVRGWPENGWKDITRGG